jgi:hypothetical protein
MRNIFICLIVLVLTSCSVSKEMEVKKESVFVDNTFDSIVYKNDSEINLNKNEKVDQIVGIEEVADFKKNDEDKLSNFGGDNTGSSVYLPKKSRIVNNNYEVLVDDYIDDNIDYRSNDKKGMLAYSIPDDLVVGEYFTVKVRISRSKSKTGIVFGNRGITIYENDINSIVSLELIDIKPVMSAQLLGDDSRFKISSLSSDYQSVEGDDYAEWDWRIMPLKSGKNYLKLLIRVKSKVDDSYKDITIFDRKILVRPNIKYTIVNFIKDYWQYISSSILIPLFTWLWSNRRKKKKKTT